MTVPLWAVLIAATWILVLVGCNHEERHSGPFGPGLGSLLYLALGVIVTLLVLLVRAWGWL